MELFDITVSYLEMLAPPKGLFVPPRDGLLVLRAQAPSVPYYRFLYNAVGEDYRWLSRRRLTDEALKAIIHDPLVEVHVLYNHGSPAGFAELDRRQPEDIELVQFGLMREFHGQGLGTWFLNWVIETAWAFPPRRFWLHTCTLDHPAALPLYQKAGFVLYEQEQIRREW